MFNVDRVGSKTGELTIPGGRFERAGGPSVAMASLVWRRNRLGRAWVDTGRLDASYRVFFRRAGARDGAGAQAGRVEQAARLLDWARGRGDQNRMRAQGLVLRRAA